MMLKTILIAALSLGLLQAQTDAEKRAREAAAVVGEIMNISDKAIPQDLLGKAQCVVVVPGLKKGAFIVGGKYGRGFSSCRKKDNVGWSAPAGMRVEGGSFGFQIGGAETDVVMLIMNERGMSKLLSSKFTLGADASVAAGPVGRDASAQTDAMMHAEILTWSRQRGVFAGIALNGATLREDETANKELYGHPIGNREILTGTVGIPKEAVVFISTLNKYSSRK